MLSTAVSKGFGSLGPRLDRRDLAPCSSLLGFEKSISALKGFASAPALPQPSRQHSKHLHARSLELPLPALLLSSPASLIKATSTAASPSAHLPQSGHPVSAFRVVNFYHLVHVDDPEQVVREHQKQLHDRDVCGRIYISAQGINAQLSGPVEDAEAYAAWVEQQSLFQGLKWTSAPADGHQFPRLRLRVKNNLVQLSGGTQRLPITSPEARAIPLQPQEWREMLRAAVPARSPSQPASAGADHEHQPPAAPGARQPWQEAQAAALAPHGSSSMPAGFDSSTPDQALGHQAAGRAGDTKSSGSAGLTEAAASASRPIVLDVRNGYEWDAGHFEGAARPQEDQFNQTPTQEEGGAGALPAHLEGIPKDTPIMMYCTGGIRCDIYSTHLRRQGFEQLYTLEGGVQRYLNQLGNDKWDGSLFVFDGRLAIPPGPADAASGSLPAAEGCAVCKGPAQLPHLNCANVDCNRLFLACPSCKEQMQGCCCAACKAAPRHLRPLKEAGHYGSYSTYLGHGKAGGGGAPFRSEHARQRRLEKRNAHRQKIRQRFVEVAAKQLAKKQLAREAMGQRMVEVASQAQEPHNSDDERYARLQELRQKLAVSSVSKQTSRHSV